jgi:hypothetical protein
MKRRESRTDCCFLLTVRLASVQYLSPPFTLTCTSTLSILLFPSLSIPPSLSLSLLFLSNSPSHPLSIRTPPISPSLVVNADYMKLPIHTQALYIPLDAVRGILIGSVVVLVPLVSLIYQLAGFHSMLGELLAEITVFHRFKHGFPWFDNSDLLSHEIKFLSAHEHTQHTSNTYSMSIMQFRSYTQHTQYVDHAIPIIYTTHTVCRSCNSDHIHNTHSMSIMQFRSYTQRTQYGNTNSTSLT